MSLHITSEIYIEDIPNECISDCTVGGVDAAPAVQHWRNELELTVERKVAVNCLLGYGAWDDAELSGKSDVEIAEMVLWLACGCFSEWDGTNESPCGSDVFSLQS